MTTPSIENLLSKDTPPSELMIISAIKADIARTLNALAEKHTKPDNLFPGTNVRVAKARLAKALGRDLLADALDTGCMPAVDAVIACDRVMAASMWDRHSDYESPTADLVEAAEALSEHTSDVCRTHMGEAA